MNTPTTITPIAIAQIVSVSVAADWPRREADGLINIGLQTVFGDGGRECAGMQLPLGGVDVRFRIREPAVSNPTNFQSYRPHVVAVCHVRGPVCYVHHTFI